MSRVVELLCSRRVPQVAVLALMSIGFAGCSADMSTRLSQNSFSNPFASQPEATGSVPTPAVERRELPQYARPQYQSQYQSSALPPPIAAPQSYPTGERRRVRRRARARLLFSAGPSAARDHRHRCAALGRGDARLGQGGTTIIVGTSDTLEILSRRYNVSSAAIMQANGYKGPRALSPGQQLIIPHPAASAAAAPALGRAGQQAGCCGERRAVASMSSITATRLLSIARRNHVSVAELAKANNLDPSAKLKLGMKLTVPGAKTAAVAPAAQPAAVAAAQPAAALRRPRPKWPPRRQPAADRASGPGHDRSSRTRRGRNAGQGQRSDRRAADLPLAGARQGDHAPTAPRPTARPMTASTWRCPRARR